MLHCTRCIRPTAETGQVLPNRFIVRKCRYARIGPNSTSRATNSRAMTSSPSSLACHAPPVHIFPGPRRTSSANAWVRTRPRWPSGSTVSASRLIAHCSAASSPTSPFATSSRNAACSPCGLKTAAPASIASTSSGPYAAHSLTERPAIQRLPHDARRGARQSQATSTTTSSGIDLDGASII